MESFLTLSTISGGRQVEPAQTVVGKWEGRSPDLWAALDFEDFVVVMDIFCLAILPTVVGPLFGSQSCQTGYIHHNVSLVQTNVCAKREPMEQREQRQSLL